MKKDITLNDLFTEFYQNPKKASFSYISAIAKSEEYPKTVVKELLKKIANPTSPLVSVEEKDLRRWYEFLLTSKLCPHQDEIAEALAKHTNGWDKIIPYLATNHGKLANPKSRQCYYKQAGIENRNIPYISSNSLPHSKSLSYSGSASYLGRRTLLETEFLFQGKIVSIYQALRNNDWELLAPLIEMGLTKEQVLKFQESATNSSCDIDPTLTDDLPQLLFPVEDGTFVSITPIPSVAILNGLRVNRSLEWGRREEYNNAIEESKKEEKDSSAKHTSYPFINFEYTYVGGANSQNSGSFNMMCGGRQYHLISSIPKIISSRTDRILRKIHKTKTLFSTPQHHSELLSSKFEKELSLLDNKSAKARIKARVEFAVEQLVKPALSLIFAIKQGEMTSQKIVEIQFRHPLEQKWILSYFGLADKLSRAETKDLAETLSQNTFGKDTSLDFRQTARPEVIDQLFHFLGRR